MENKKCQQLKTSEVSATDGSLQLPEGPAIAFRNLKNAKLLAMDIGGSLAKIAYYSTVPVKRSVVYPSESTTEKQKHNGNTTDEGGKICYEVQDGARLHFISFETRQIEKCLDYVRKTLVAEQSEETSDSNIPIPKAITAGKRIYVAGGGAYKYCDLIESKLNLTVVKVDEMDCICAGSNFLIRNIADETFTYDRIQSPPFNFQQVQEKDTYPYLLVIIGSGVSILKVESESKFERIGGTATGGGTFWGLGSLLTGAKGFDELLNLATQGDFRQVDMLVKDIYGDRESEYTSLGLSPTIIASSFGKAIHYDSSSSSNPTMTKADMARSLLYMVSNDIGQISTLYAMLHNVKNIYFGGFFLRHHPVSLHTISYAVNYWSKGKVKANFLRHEGYLGAMGAFLKGCEAELADIEILKPFENLENCSWTENLYGSTPSFHDPLIVSGTWQAGSTSSDVEGSRKRTKSDSVSMGGAASPYPTSSLTKTRSRSPGDSDDEDECRQFEDDQSESDCSVDNDSSSTSLIEVTDHLEIDRYETRLGTCPLLMQPENYIADTVDLTRDHEARDYWLACFEDSLPKFADRAVASQAPSEDIPIQTNSSNSKDDMAKSLQNTSNKNNVVTSLENIKNRSEKFKETFLARIQTLRNQPFAHGNLTVRSLLDMREHCLSEFDFHDPYLKQKRLENDQAFALLPELLKKLHGLEWGALQEALAIGMLAGNVFDWGAKEVALLMENQEGGLKFDDALSFVRPRPWLVDDLDAWKSRLRLDKNGSNEVGSLGPHKCAAIFIDNSGVDVILGMLPFVEHLLSRGTEVLLCANNRPVLNDVTYAELVLIVHRAARISPIIEKNLKSGKLLCLNSGQSSACLDLARLNWSLVDQMIQRKVDLVVLEGMGRAVHTNFYANFNCECLKVAVLKNRWLAKRLGGDMFAVVFKYEIPPPKQTQET